MTESAAATLSEIDLGRARLLVLDFDGIITRLPLDWPGLKRDLSRLCREELGLEVIFSPVASGRQKVLSLRGRKALAKVDAWLAEREMAALSAASLSPGVMDLLESRPETKVAIFSANSRTVLLEALGRFGLAERVSMVIGREDVENLKPAPDGLLKILAATGCPPEEAVFVGDRDVDEHAGQAAGVRTWIVGHKETSRLAGIAAAHDYEEGFNGRLTRYRARAIMKMVPPGGSLLELGCGGGALSRALAGHFDSLTVVEGSEEYLARARRRLPRETRCLRSLVEDLRLEETFSCVLASGLLEHVEDPVAVVRKAADWLREDGLAVFLVPNARSLHRRIGMAMGALERLDALQAHDHEVGHRRYYTRETFRGDLEAGGLEIAAEGGVYLKPLANWQMEGWDQALTDAFFQVGEELPDYCAELIATGRPGRRPG